jgi:NAD(P)-dependent dehydrogenase (short-subunit alcohol dehydrogenase family)
MTDVTPDRELAGQVAVVTGGSSGIGRACATALARAGARVTACALPDDAFAEAESALAAGGVELLAVDVTDARATTALIDGVAERAGGLHVLVNSVGIQRYGTVVETDDEMWDLVLRTNVTSMLHTCRAAVPHIAAAGGGAIVNVSSVQGFVAQTGAAAYVASKGAVNAFTRALAVDHAPDGIRVNAVCPGSVDTTMLRWAAGLHAGGGTSAEDLLHEWGRAHPLGRVATADEVAEVVRFLAGPRSSFIAGALLPVDGALTAQAGVRLADTAELAR